MGRFTLFSVLIFSKFRQSQPCENVSEDSLFTAFQSVTSSVSESHTYCSQLNLLYESNSLLSALSALPTKVIDMMNFTVRAPSVSLMVDLSLTANSNEPQKLFHYQNSHWYKHHQPCTVIFFKLSSELLENVHLLNNGTVGQRWPERILPLLPNDVHRSFFVFFTPEIDFDSSIKSVINDFMQETGMIHHSVFIIPRCTSEVDIFVGVPKVPQEMRVVATVWKEQFKKLESPNVYQKDFDFHGEPLLTLFCIVCGPPDEDPGPRYIPDAYMTIWWLTLQDFNATPASEKLFITPSNGLTDEGGFDDYLLPVVEGNAVMIGMITPSFLTFHLLENTRPFWFDSIFFVTGQGKAVNKGGISMIRQPFGLFVWMAVIISSLSIIACVEALLCVAGNQKPDVSLWFWLMEIIYKPVVLQAGYETKTFRKRVGKLYRVHIIISIWLLSLIVLGCAYSSSLLGVVAFPRIIQPPQTFQELAEDPTYEIEGFLTPALVLDLRASNQTAYVKIADRFTEQDFTAETCYQGIFERKMACMGYWSAFTHLGMEFMLDIHGRMLYAQSKDSHYFTNGGIGVSKFYPMITEKVDYYVGVMDSNGINVLGPELSKRKQHKKGKAYAKSQVTEKKYYRGSDQDNSDEDRKVLGIVLQILQFGGLISVTVLICEVVSYKLRVSRRKSSVVMEDFRIRREIYDPKIYSHEFKNTSFNLMPLKSIVMVRCDNLSHDYAGIDY